MSNVIALFIGTLVGCGIARVAILLAHRARDRRAEREFEERMDELKRKLTERSNSIRGNSHIIPAGDFTFSIKCDGVWKDIEAQSFNFVNDYADAFRWLSENVNNSADAISDLAMGLDAIEADDEWLEPFEKWADEHKDGDA